MTFKIFIFLIAIFFLLRFVLRFIMPLVKITRLAQNQMQQMKGKMDAMQQEHNQPTPNRASKKIDGDYIEYEEVK